MGSSAVPSGQCRRGLLLRRPGATKRLWRASVALVACIASIFSLGAQPIGSVPASAQLLAAGSPVDASTGCPKALPEYALNDLDLGPGLRCVSWPVSTFEQVSGGADGTCGGATFILVPLSKNADGYFAFWNRTGPNADPSPSEPWVFVSNVRGPAEDEVWSTTTITPGNTGVDVNYDVPTGDGAWFVGAGGGTCSDVESSAGVARAWAVTYKREVSGQVTVAGPAGPAPGITMNASCPSGGTTTTDTNGNYEFLLDKGPCTIAPELKPGDISTPVQRVLNVTTDINNVNFVVPCDAVSAGPAGTGSDGPRQPDAALVPAVSSASSADCLQVFIKIVGPIPNVGTRSGLSVDNYVPDDGPVNFTTLTGAPHESTPLVAIHQVGQQCVSGCANILISVVNKVTHLPATDAEVNVGLGTIDTAESPDLHQQGSQFLCVQTGDFENQDCGIGLNGLKTDANGQVRLLYWAPGEMVRAHVELSAQACTPSACALKHATSKITVYPYRIFHYQAELSPEDVAVLVGMVRTAGFFELWSKAAEQGFEYVAHQWIHLLEVESTAVTLALGPIGFAVAFAAVDLAHETSEALESLALRAAFFTATGLSDAGLGVASYRTFSKVGPLDDVCFAALVLRVGKFDSQGCSWPIFNHPEGWLWELAKQWTDEYSNYTEWPPRAPVGLVTLKPVKPEPIDLSMYETSYCVGGAHCGPGYGSLHSPDIRTDLCIYIAQLGSTGSTTCGIYYNAPIWVASQEGVDTKLGHPKALGTSLP